MSWNTIIVNAIILMMSFYYIKNVLNGLIRLKQLWKKLNEFKPVVHCRRWKNNKKNQKQEILCLYKFSL